MKGSEFLAAHANDSLSQWEAAVVQLARSGDGIVSWPMVPVTVRAGGHEGTFLVTSDYLSVGEPGDFLRMPMTPLAAQRALDALGLVLPTPKMVKDIWAASTVKTTPAPLSPNRGASLPQFAQHQETVQADADVRGSAGRLISGQKKDVVVGRLVTPGKVVIFGWFRPDGTNIQPRTNVHGDGYVDYSQGIRGVSPRMTVDGRDIAVADVLSSPALSPLLSDEGPIAPAQQRYPVPRTAPAIARIGPLLVGPGGTVVAVLAGTALAVGASYLAWTYRSELFGVRKRRAA